MTIFTTHFAGNSFKTESYFCDTLPPLNVTLSNITSTSVTIHWANDPFTSDYFVRLRPLNSSIWHSFMAINQDYYTITGLMSCATYEVQVSKFCNNTQGTWSSIMVFTTLSPNVCSSASLDFANKSISNVTLTPIPMYGMLPMVSNSFGSNYTDYRPDSTRKITLLIGSTGNTISITKSGNPLSTNDKVNVWIDFNGDGIFQSSERILMSTSNTTQTVSQTFNVPATVAPCEVTMRVIYSNIDVVNGCGSFDEGEVEDYGVFFVSAASLSVSENVKNNALQIYPNPARDHLNIIGVSDSTKYEIYNSVGQKVGNGKTRNQSINVSYLTKGVYFIEVNNKGKLVKLKFIKE